MERSESEESRLSYSAIDPTLIEWANAHGLRLINEFGSVPSRFCYVSGGQKECFQVSIEPPEGEKVLVNAWSIETDDDAELHHAWTASIDELRSTLETALEKIKEWKSRPRNPGASVR
jgi:hypothetical protein